MTREPVAAASTMTFQAALLDVFGKSLVYGGRSGKGEYWAWALMSFIVFIVADGMDYLLFLAEMPIEGLFSVIVTVNLIVPGIAVTARRLHDIGRSGWWQVVPIFAVVVPSMTSVTNVVAAVAILVLLVGSWLWLFYMMARPGTRSDNRYGPPPEASRVEEPPRDWFRQPRS